MYRGEIVEMLPVERLRRGEAEHPYTRTLLTASLVADRGGKEVENPDSVLSSQTK